MPATVIYTKEKLEAMWLKRKARYIRNWAGNIVSGSRSSDKAKDRFESQGFLTKEFVLNQRVVQNNKCFYCNKEMQIKNRQLSDGLTIERLNNRIGHTMSNCVLACYKCNMARCLM